MTDKNEARPGIWKIQRLMCLVVRILFQILFGLRSINAPKLEGPYILAPNHTSFLDPMLVQLTVNRHISFMMDGKLHSHKLFNWFYRFWKVIPLPATTQAAGAMKDCLKRVKSGQVVGIFPEGQIALDGQLQEGMAGVGTLMQRSRVPVVPVAILGAFEVLPRNARFPRPGRLLVVFGDPIEPDAQAEDKKLAAQQLSDRVMAEIKKLLDEHAIQR